MKMIDFGSMEWLLLGSVLALGAVYIIGEIRAIRRSRAELSETIDMAEQMSELESKLESIQQTLTSIKNVLTILHPEVNKHISTMDRSTKGVVAIHRRGKTIKVKDEEEVNVG